MGQNSFPRAHRTSKERVERFTDKEGEARLGQAGLRIYPRRACSRVHARAAYTNGSAAPRRAAQPCLVVYRLLGATVVLARHCYSSVAV